MKFTKNLSFCFLILVVVFTCTEARPQSSDDKPDFNNLETDAALSENEGRSIYFDLPMQSYYSNIPMDRLQMLLAQYKPSNFLRAPSYNELYRLPETKRQVRYRQCYFNPISCFKK